MKRKHFDFVKTKFNLRIEDWDVVFKGRKIGSLYVIDDDYVFNAYDREYNIIDKGALMDYLRKKELKFKKLEIKERLEKIKGDF